MYSDGKISTTYRMLKHRLRKKVLNSVLFLEHSESHKNRLCFQETNDCQFLLHQARKLYYFGEYQTAAKLTEQALIIAHSAELTEFIVKGLELQREASLLVYNKKAFTLADQKLQTYYKLAVAEQKAETIYLNARCQVMGGSTADRNRFLPQLPSIIEELKDTWTRYPIPRIYSFYHLLSITWLELSGDFLGIFNVIQQGEELVAKGILNAKWFNTRFNNYIKIYSLIRINEYERGLELAKKHISDYDTNNVNWFAFIENYIVLSIYSRKYSLAIELLGQVFDNEYFPNLYRNKKELWELYRRFILLVCDPKLTRTTSFIQRPVCELKVLSTDKEGYNLPILILHFVESLADMSEETLETYIDRISKYISKYLKGDKVERVRTFMRLLLLVAKEGGNRERVQAKSKLLLKKLSASKNGKDTLAELEFVPYEHLWEVVLGMLQRRKTSFNYYR